jgi:hypothetical protein
MALPYYDSVWAFALRDEPDGTTRLLVRERYAYTRPWARLLIEPTEAGQLRAGSRAADSALPSAGSHPPATSWIA